MPIDLLGPGAFGAARAAASRPDITPSNTGADTWAQDCTTPTAADGTEDRAAHMNAILAQLRAGIRAGAVTEDNEDDAMLARAMRSQRPNWIGTVGGSANALTATLSPAPDDWADLVGTPFRLITASANTTTTPTLNLNALGAKTLVFADGSPLTANAWGTGALLEVFYDGTNVRILSGADRGASRFVNRFADSTPGTRNFTAVVTGWHEIELVGGGGGGGPAVSGAYASGGSGATRVVDVVFLQAGTNYSYTVGGAGAAGVAGVSAATAGGNTTFAAPGGTVTAPGGAAGQSSGSGVTGTAGSGFSSNGFSELGQPGFSSAPQISQGGPGGDSTAGGFGGAASFGVGNVGGAPGGGGSGGAGGAGNVNGGAGSVGRVTVKW